MGDDTNLIVFVHGINVSYIDWGIGGDTVFKRLYWSGFAGKFAAVKWPCNYLTPIPDPLTPAVFNQSEAKAYKASTAFASYVGNLHTRFPNNRLHLYAHSQGNPVVSEAIARTNLAFDTYILSQAALPDSAYDLNAPTNSVLLAREQGLSITPDWKPFGYHGLYTNLTGRIVNFYNPQDKVLDYWVSDQKLLKPSVFFDSSFYYYDGTNCYFAPYNGIYYMITDPEETRAMVARSRTLPLGQSGPASSHGVIQSAVDLNAQFGFFNIVDEHSAQWTRPIQTSRPYFQQVLTSCQILPAP